MHKSRLEAFSDGVFAIIITIMVLELKVPHTADAAALIKLAPIFFSYVLSFVFVGIYWVNHHHMFQIVKNVNGKVLWLNIYLLFWLSLTPFTTAWMGENKFATLPVAIYGFVLLMSAFAYYFLSLALKANHAKDSEFHKAFGGDIKGKLSLVLYIIAVAASLYHPYFSIGIYVLVALIWFVPDKRVERLFN